MSGNGYFRHSQIAMELAYRLLKEWNDWEHDQLKLFKQHNKEDRVGIKQKPKPGGYKK